MSRVSTVFALWWLVNATGYMSEYTGPFGTIETCKAAREGAISESVLAECVTPEQYDDYLQWTRDYYDSMGHGGNDT